MILHTYSSFQRDLTDYLTQLSIFLMCLRLQFHLNELERECSRSPSCVLYLLLPHQLHPIPAPGLNHSSRRNTHTMFWSFRNGRNIFRLLLRSLSVRMDEIMVTTLWGVVSRTFALPSSSSFSRRYVIQGILVCLLLYCISMLSKTLAKNLGFLIRVIFRLLRTSFETYKKHYDM